MIYGSVCSGIEAASAAWHSLGWRAAFVSEIEKFPSQVLAHHYPDVPNLGDMTKYKEWPDAAIDVLVGGTPCQSFSVAGLRGGLDDSRGNLMLTYAEIAHRYRPQWLVWENVPGCLSSAGGADFASLLAVLSGRAVVAPAGGWKNTGIVPGVEGAYGLAWRVLDAQFFGVPQRRRRVFVVGCLGGWQRAAAVLIERQSLLRNPPPRREARQRVAGTVKGGSGSRGYPDPSDGNGGRIVGPLEARHAGGYQSAQSAAAGHLVTEALPPDTVGALTDGAHNGGGLNGQDAYTGRIFPVVTRACPDDMQTLAPARMSSGQANAEISVDRAPTLNCLHEAPVVAFAHQAGGAQTPAIAFDTTQITSKANRSNPQAGDPSHPLAAGAHPPAIALPIDTQNMTEGHASGGKGYGDHGDHGDPSFTITKGHNHAVAFEARIARNGRGAPSDVVPPLKAQSGQSGKGDAAPLCLAPALTASNDPSRSPQSSEVTQQVAAVHSAAMQVRRLTPMECERLQGFPDGYTLIPIGNKMSADGPRYKALGNSMAVPVMHWIGRRIAFVSKLEGGGK